MKTLTLATLLASTLAGPALAAGFTGAADPAAFAVANVGTLTGSLPSFGTATFSPIQLVLVGSNTAAAAPSGSGCAGGVYSTLSSPCQVQAVLAVPGLYSFNWSYVSADADGPAGDLFGVVVDGNRIALSDLGGAVAQTGSASFAATASFGWFINCTDCLGGFGTATVSTFNLTAVPEPASYALLLAGTLAISALSLAKLRPTASRA